MGNELGLWLEAALQQIAAESHFEGVSTDNRQAVIARLILGNNPEGAQTPGFLRMTDSQAAAFADQYEIIDQAPNDASGFSATLLRNRNTLEYTLAFRSTEYRNRSNGGDFERDAQGADREIGVDGFAIGQISSMRKYFSRLLDGRRADGSADAKVQEFAAAIAGGGRINAVGYSLGGHLAQAFALMNRNKVSHLYLFNSPGLGRINDGSSLSRLIDRYDEIIANPGAARAETDGDRTVLFLARAEAMRTNGVLPGPDGDLYRDRRHIWAVRNVTQLTTGVRSMDEAIVTYVPTTNIYGHATHGDTELVANTGIHPPALAIFVEDQPDIEGWVGKLPFPPFTMLPDGMGDFGNTHSLTLIVDSLAVMSGFLAADPTLTLGELRSILAEGSNARASGVLGRAGVAEGDSLEGALDSLRRLYLGSSYTGATPSQSAGGSFGSIEDRRILHANIDQLKAAAQAKGSAGVVPLVAASQFSSANGEPVPSFAVPSPESLVSAASAATANGQAYRYALRELNPFVVSGNDALYQAFNQAGELDLFDPATGLGSMSASYLSDRAEMLVALLSMNGRDSGYVGGTVGVESILYEDRGIRGPQRAFLFDSATATDQARVFDSLPSPQREQQMQRLFNSQSQKDKGRKILFGRDANPGTPDADPDTRPGGRDELLGGNLDDHLYGGGGNDTLLGGLGDDRLEGGLGDDVLRGGPSSGSLPFGSTDNDTLLGGAGNDVLAGGLGTDKYYFYTGGGADTVMDVAEGVDPPRRHVSFGASARQLLATAPREG